MESSVQRLINNLKKLSECEELNNVLEVNLEKDQFWLNETTDTYKEVATDELKALVDEILIDIDEWLIADNGGHHFPNRETLNRFGYRFEKGEEDGFGPLTSVIVIPILFELKTELQRSHFRMSYG